MSVRRHRDRSSSQRGAALLAALCFTLVLAIALSSYITVCYRALQMSTRNVAAGHTVELAETGMEEALWALQNNSWSSWTISGTTATKTLSGFSYDNNSTGSASLTVTNYNSGTRTITVVGTVTYSDGTTTSRTLTSSASQAPIFVNALAGKNGKIKLKVAGTIDSYDSSINPDVLPTAGGQTVGYSAILSSGSVSTTSSTVQLTNAQVKGYVAMLSSSPSNLFYTVGGTAKIIGPNTAATTNIDTTRIGTSPYQPIVDVVTPTAVTPLPSFPLSTSTNTIGTAGATVSSKYYATTFSLSGSQILYIDGPVVIVVTGSVSISSSAKIVINNSANASLELHVGADLALAGNGIDNRTKLPKNLAIFEIANSSTYTWDMSTSTPFYGVIYTPDQSLTLGNAQTIYGAIVANSITFNLSPTFHYDINLRNVTFPGLSTPYAVSSVRETGP